MSREREYVLLLVQVWKVQEFLHVKPGKGSAFVRSKLKNIESGSILEKTWRSGEAVTEAQVEKDEMQFSYIDEDKHVFMNLETFEEERIASADIDRVEFIKESMILNVLKWKGKAIDVQVCEWKQHGATITFQKERNTLSHITVRQHVAFFPQTKSGHAAYLCSIGSCRCST